MTTDEQTHPFVLNDAGQPSDTAATLTPNHLEKLWAWGGASGGLSHVFRPTNIAGIQAVFDLARSSGRTVGFRGGGNSYGDAALNGENLLLDLRRMNRILDWDPVTGRVRAEPGVTLAQLWQHTLEDGWWPPVVTGTMKTTLGGCAAMNVHGKNCWPAGPIGNHIYAFDFLLPTGELITCSRDENAAIFFAAIGGLGLLGCFTSITLDLKRVYSGYLQVEAQATSSLDAALATMEALAPQADYIVGWLDGTARGGALGRGELHVANYVPPGADPYPNQSLRLDVQALPDTLLGVVPKSILWRFMRPFMNRHALRLINTAKYVQARRHHGDRYRQTHAAFHFLLDYVPHWKKAYGPQGLIQYQVFLPRDTAAGALREILTLGQQRGLPNYLSVLKRHRADAFLLTHGLDGFSLAMDFRITRRNRARVVALCQAMDSVVLAAGGRFYFAKDSTLRPEVARAYLGDAALAQFAALRQRCDPEQLLSTNLWRRVFGA